jgi:hypothetical protein
VYDEFSVLRKVSPSIFTRFRAILQHSMTHTAYVFMGSELAMMEQLFKNPEEMPFGMAVSMTLPPPTNAEWHRYIEQRFADLKVVIRAGEADDLIEFCGGHPRDLMEACEHLVALRALNPRAEGLVRVAERKTLDSLRVRFDELWKRLEETAGTQTTAARMASGHPIYGRGRSGTQVRRTVEKLEEEGIVRRTGKGAFEFVEPLFGRYVLELTR